MSIHLTAELICFPTGTLLTTNRCYIQLNPRIRISLNRLWAQKLENLMINAKNNRAFAFTSVHYLGDGNILVINSSYIGDKNIAQ